LVGLKRLPLPVPAGICPQSDRESCSRLHEGVRPIEAAIRVARSRVSRRAPFAVLGIGRVRGSGLLFWYLVGRSGGDVLRVVAERLVDFGGHEQTMQ
jgi:hypothetical protein